MIAEKMKGLVANSSAIRAMFEEGNRLAGIYGAENVFDFSLGNPNVPAPEAVKKAIEDLVESEDPLVLHWIHQQQQWLRRCPRSGSKVSE